MTQKQVAKHPINPVCITPFHDAMNGLGLAQVTAPASAAWGTANLAHFYPINLLEPLTVLKPYWTNGSTIGTDNIDMAIYRLTDPATGRMDMIRSIGATPSGATASVVQEAGWPQVTCLNVTSSNSSADATTYTTAAVQLRIGKLYLLSVENSAASAGAVSSIDNGPTFTSRSTTQYNTTANRVSIWSAVPVSNYNGTLVINFGANTQTGCVWSLEEFSGVDTSSNNGVVQQNVGTGTSVTPQVTLGAFTAVYNATYFACSNIADTTTTPKARFVELVDISAATPLQTLETQWAQVNDTTPNGTITSGVWGACAVEIKAATRPGPWRISRALITNGNDSVDRLSYTTASVTLKKGRLYLMAVANSGSTQLTTDPPACTGGGTWTLQTSPHTAGAGYVSISSCVPTADYTGTISIDYVYGHAQTGCIWALVEFVGVDTTTWDGIVQRGTGAGNTTTPLVEMLAFSGLNNATFACHVNVGDSTTTPGRGFTELTDDGTATPTQYLETQWRQDDATYCEATITSGEWVSCAVEIKCDTSSPVIIPESKPETPNVYMAFVVNGTTATLLSDSPALSNLRAAGIMSQASTFPLPSSLLVTGVAPSRVPLAGCSSRSLIG
jgi:hypothetical protein